MKLISRIAALCVALSLTQAFAAGTTPLSLAQQIDVNGQPLANCQLYFFVAGTPATPQNAFADFGLTQTLPNPLSCDQTGRVPQHWIADGLIHIRLTDSTGLQIIDTTMQVLGPSSGGGGGGGTVDPTTILATGDEKIRYGTGPIAGFVRENGLTIGNATSGATERANADTQALFVYLYNANANLVVSGGRTGNALNDFNASKRLTLPDMRGAAAAGLDDMGNSAKGVFAGVTFTSGNATTLDSLVGAARRTLTVGQLPTGITSTNPSQGITVPTGGSGHVATYLTPTTFPAPTTGSVASVFDASGSGNIQIVTSFSGNNSISVTSTNTLGQAFDSVSPYALRTFYIKL